MFRRERSEHDERPRPRGASTKLAYCVLLGGAGLLATRALFATIIQVHGDGMAPTILDGESVIMVRGTWGLEPGDLVVYDPTPEEAACEDEDEPARRRLPSPAPGPSEKGTQVDETRSPRGELHDAAVVEVDDVESNWQRVRDRGTQARPRNFRVGRVLARPGDTVTFHVPDASLGLVVNGSPLQQKLDDPIRLVLAGQPSPGEAPSDKPRLRPFAWETLGDIRYPVLPATTLPAWESIGLPDDLGPLEIQAEGYLILADNRDEGACCDSRALGWIGADKIRGEVVVRLAGDPGAAPDSDPRSRGLARLP